MFSGEVILGQSRINRVLLSLFLEVILSSLRNFRKSVKEIQILFSLERQRRKVIYEIYNDYNRPSVAID